MIRCRCLLFAVLFFCLCPLAQAFFSCPGFAKLVDDADCIVVAGFEQGDGETGRFKTLRALKGEPGPSLTIADVPFSHGQDLPWRTEKSPLKPGDEALLFLTKNDRSTPDHGGGDYWIYLPFSEYYCFPVDKGIVRRWCYAWGNDPEEMTIDVPLESVVKQIEHALSASKQNGASAPVARGGDDFERRLMMIVDGADVVATAKVARFFKDRDGEMSCELELGRRMKGDALNPVFARHFSSEQGKEDETSLEHRLGEGDELLVLLISPVFDEQGARYRHLLYQLFVLRRDGTVEWTDSNHSIHFKALAQSRAEVLDMVSRVVRDAFGKKAWYLERWK